MNKLVHPRTIEWHTRRYGKPPIRDFKDREAWAKQNENYSVLAIYNSGRNLFLDPRRSRASSYYDREWKWMDYKTYREPAEIVVSDRLLLGIPDSVLFQTLGHDHKYRYAQVRVGLECGLNTIKVQPYAIPPLCIRYFGIFYFRVRTTMLVFQPLPMDLHTWADQEALRSA